MLAFEDPNAPQAPRAPSPTSSHRSPSPSHRAPSPTSSYRGGRDARPIVPQPSTRMGPPLTPGHEAERAPVVSTAVATAPVPSGKGSVVARGRARGASERVARQLAEVLGTEEGEAELATRLSSMRMWYAGVSSARTRLWVR